jgi:hypothetical protein
MKVKRINGDNYPDCKVNDIGILCDDTPKSITSYGTSDKLLEMGMVLVDFGKGPTPNLIKHLLF